MQIECAARRIDLPDLAERRVEDAKGRKGRRVRGGERAQFDAHGGGPNACRLWRHTVEVRVIDHVCRAASEGCEAAAHDLRNLLPTRCESIEAAAAHSEVTRASDRCSRGLRGIIVHGSHLNRRKRQIRSWRDVVRLELLPVCKLVAEEKMSGGLWVEGEARYAVRRYFGGGGRIVSAAACGG